jgi:hypothetical protein
MSIELHEEAEGKILVVRAAGRLTKQDYERFVPEVDRLIAQHGTIRIFFDMMDFRGWTAKALWADLKFAVAHFRDIERLAVVGDRAWEHGMAIVCRPFTKAEIRYFDHSEEDEARAWIGLAPARSQELVESVSR